MTERVVSYTLNEDLESWARKPLPRVEVQHCPGDAERLVDGSRKPWIIIVQCEEDERTQEWVCKQTMCTIDSNTSSSSIFDCALRQTLARQYAHRYNRARRAQTLQDTIRFVPLLVYKLVDRGDSLVLVHPPLTGANRKWTEAERRGQCLCLLKSVLLVREARF